MALMINWQAMLASLDNGDQIERLFHGRGRPDQYANFVVDWFKPVVVLRVYQPSDLEALLIEQLLAAAANIDDIKVVVQRRWLRDDSWQWLKGEPVELLTATSRGISMQVRLGSHQNVGVFHDMAPVHQWVQERAQSMRVLNLFAYTCAFSVAALKGGAQLCVNADMASGALSTGRVNHRLNNIDQGAKFLKLDVLKSFGRFKREGPFDLVIADPPSFQRNSFEAERHYGKLLNRLGEVLAEGGEALFCLNDPAVSDHQFRQWIIDNGNWQIVERLPAAQSFIDANLDTALKVLRCKPIKCATTKA